MVDRIITVGAVTSVQAMDIPGMDTVRTVRRCMVCLVTIRRWYGRYRFPCLYRERRFMEDTRAEDSQVGTTGFRGVYLLVGTRILVTSGTVVGRDFRSGIADS